MKTAVGLVMFSLSILPIQAQERTPDVVERLLERRIPPEAQFVPGEIIVKMRYAYAVQGADLRRLGIQEKERITSGGEIIYKITPALRSTMSSAKLRDQTLKIASQLNSRPSVWLSASLCF